MNQGSGAGRADATGLRARLLRGFGAQGLQLAARIVQQIVLVPLLIGAWGRDTYADWIVLFAAASLVPMLELGTQAFYGNMLLAAWAGGAREHFARLLALALGVQLAIVVLACLAAGAASLVVDWPAALGVRSLPPSEALLILFFLSAGNLLTVPQGVVSTVYRARGEFSRLVNTVTLLLVLESSGMVVVVLAGGSPVSTAAIYAAAILLSWAVMLFDQRRRYRDLRYGLRRPTRAELRHLAATAPFYLVSSATTTVVASGPIILMQLVAPGAAIVAFATSRLLVNILRQLTHQLAHASGVEMARQLVQGEAPALQRLFIQTGRLAGGIFGLFGGALMVGAEPFFLLWTRGSLRFEPWLFAALLANIYLILPGQPALTLLYYSNQPRPIGLASAAQATLGLALCAALSPVWGATGAAAGLALAEWLVVGLWLARRGAQSIDVPLRPYILSTYGTGLLCFTLSFAVAELALDATRPAGIAGLVAFAAVWAGGVATPAFFLLLNRWQRGWVVDILSRRLLMGRST